MTKVPEQRAPNDFDYVSPIYIIQIINGNYLTKNLGKRCALMHSLQNSCAKFQQNKSVLDYYLDGFFLDKFYFEFYGEKNRGLMKPPRNFQRINLASHETEQDTHNKNWPLYLDKLKKTEFKQLITPIRKGVNIQIPFCDLNHHSGPVYNTNLFLYFQFELLTCQFSFLIFPFTVLSTVVLHV